MAWSGEEYLALAGVIAASIGAVATAILTARKGKDAEAEKDYEPKAYQVTLHPDYRTALAKVTESIDEGSRRVVDVLDAHRRAIDGQTRIIANDQSQPRRRPPRR